MESHSFEADFSLSFVVSSMGLKSNCLIGVIGQQPPVAAPEQKHDGSEQVVIFRLHLQIANAS
jgi:hypothetical protein